MQKAGREGDTNRLRGSGVFFMGRRGSGIKNGGKRDCGRRGGKASGNKVRNIKDNLLRWGQGNYPIYWGGG